MERVKLFLSNLLIYGLGGAVGKIIPFIMLPVITRLFPETFYIGLNDLSNVIVSFTTAITIMGMYDAMFRMFFEREDEDFKKQVCSSAFYFVLLISCTVCLLMIIFRNGLSRLIFGSELYVNLFLLSVMSALISSTNSIVAAPTRFQNKRVLFLITNTVAPLISYSISIPLLIKGLYIIALPLASILSAALIEIFFWSQNKKWFSIHCINKRLIKQMLRIGLPLVPNFLIYWIFNSSDKLLVAKILGNDEMGIYTVGSKIGQVSQLIYLAFAGGWQYFAFSTMKDDDQVQLNSSIFEYLGVITFSVTMCICPIMKSIFQFMFAKEYLKGYLVAPYLFLAPLLLMLYQIEDNQFLVIKKTWPSVAVLFFGAVFNIIIDILLIPQIGIEGAAIATLLGYTISIVTCSVVLIRMKLLIISKRFIFCILSFIFFLLVWRMMLQNIIIAPIVLAVCIIIFYFCLYKKDVKKLMERIKKDE